MKLKIVILFISFTTFIIAPIMLSSFCKNIDFSIVFSMAEEEENHKLQFDKLTEFFTVNIDESHYKYQRKTDKITAEFLFGYGNGFTKIFLPPPEFTQYII